MTAMSLYRQTSDGSVYADPAKPNFTVRFKTSSAPKSLSGQKTVNYITEIIVNDDIPVTIAGNGVVDPGSIRIRVSGSVESQERLQAILASVAAQLPDWSDENVFVGFNPVTPPAVPA